jgi:predicted SAM-dependent methyltransferase
MSTERIREFIFRHPHVQRLYLLSRGISNSILRQNPLQKLSHRVRTLDYLNIGCNKKVFSHTINLDYSWFPGIDLTMDMRKRLPISDSRLRGIYCEHVIEHLPFDVIPFCFSEWRRVLRPGGVVRVIVPDAELYLQTYCRIKIGEDIRFPYHEPEKTPMMHVNRVFRLSGHQYAYDFDTLAFLLDKACFKDIVRCEHKKGRDKNLLIDSDDREIESLRVEAVYYG